MKTLRRILRTFWPRRNNPYVGLLALALWSGCASPKPLPPLPPGMKAMSHSVTETQSAPVPRQVVASWNECGPLPADCVYRLFTREALGGPVTLHDTRETSLSLSVTNNLFATLGLVLPDGTVLMAVGKECP